MTKAFNAKPVASYDCVIIGAGITGLTLAYRLKKAGISVILLEAGTNVGGNIQTRICGDYLLEFGPHSAFARPALASLVDELGLSGVTLHTEENSLKRYFATQNQGNKRLTLKPFPSSFFQALKSQILSPSAKLRVLCEAVIPKKDFSDESVEAFIKRRFGAQVADNIAATVMSGIWAADIKQLSARSALPKFWEYQHSHGSLLRGFLKNSRPGRLDALSFKNGMCALPQALAAKLDDHELCLQTAVIDLRFENGQVRLFVKRGLANNAQKNLLHEQQSEEILAQNVVITTPAAVTAALLPDIAPRLASLVGSVPYSSVGTLCLAFSKKSLAHYRDCSGFLVQPKAGQSLLGVLFSSRMFPGRSPKEMELLTCFTGMNSDPKKIDVANPTVREKVIAEVCSILRTEEKPTVVDMRFETQAIPAYALGHHQIVDKIEQFHRKQPNVRLIGNWIRGLGLSDRVEQANLLAAEIIKQRQSSRNSQLNFSSYSADQKIV